MNLGSVFIYHKNLGMSREGVYIGRKDRSGKKQNYNKAAFYYDGRIQL